MPTEDPETWAWLDQASALYDAAVWLGRWAGAVLCVAIVVAVIWRAFL